jgi:hypothetical protein
MSYETQMCIWILGMTLGPIATFYAFTKFIIPLLILFY